MAVHKIQRNIIIGADAQQFYDAMRGINNQIAHVDATMKRMDQNMMRNVAGGHLLSQAITMVGRAFVQYINAAVDSAQKLPEGLFEGVDALRAARKEAEDMSTAMGVAFSGSVAWATELGNIIKTEWIGFTENIKKDGFGVRFSQVEMLLMQRVKLS